MAGGVAVEVRRAGGAVERFRREPCAHERRVVATTEGRLGDMPWLTMVEACEACGAVLGPLHPALLSPGVRA